MKKIVQNTAKKRIKLAGTSPMASHSYKEQLRAMTDTELVRHRRELMQGHDGWTPDYWSRMWSINAEMAMRFSKAVRKGEEK